MNGLVEKVARAICQTDSDPDEVIGGNPMWKGWQDEARAAITAVAEWMETELRTDDADPYVSIALRKQLEQPK